MKLSILDRQSPLVRSGKTVERAICQVSRPIRDRMINRRVMTPGPRIALVRYVHGMPSYYKLFLKWMEEKFPELRARFELRLLSQPITDWSRYELVVPWITENVLFELPKQQRRFLRLVAEADDHGVPVTNRPEALMGTSKFDGPRRMAELGVRTPNVVRISDAGKFRRDQGGLEPPFLVREELGHNVQNPILFVSSLDDLQQIPLESFSHPMAVEFVDVRDRQDGLVRKYRYMAVGEMGVSHSLYISDDWEVRGSTQLYTESTRREEIEFTSSVDPNHELFQTVRRGLGLDYVAFDYSYDRQGNVVVWEINVLPGLDLPSKPEDAHHGLPFERAMAATVKMYLRYAGIDAPAALDDLLGPPVAGNHYPEPAVTTGNVQRRAAG